MTRRRKKTSFSPTPLFSALLQHGLLFAPRLLLAAQMNERQRQASVTMRTRLVRRCLRECHLRDRFLVSHRGAAQVLDASPFRLTSEPSPHGHAIEPSDASLSDGLCATGPLACLAHALHFTLHQKKRMCEAWASRPFRYPYCGFAVEKKMIAAPCAGASGD